MLDFIISSYWLTIYLLLFFGFNFSRKNTTMIAAFIHATSVTALSAISLYSYGVDFQRYNLLLESITSKISFWYFLNDLIILLIFDRNIVYIVHHLCALTAFYVIMNLGFGLSASMLILFLGEITNPIRLAKTMVYEHNKFIYKILNFVFSWLFLFMRCIFMSYYYILMFYQFIPFIPDEYERNLILASTTIGLLGGYFWSGLIINKKIKCLNNKKHNK